MEEIMTVENVRILARSKGYKLEQINDFYALYKITSGGKKAEEMPYFSRSLLGMKLWLQAQNVVKEPMIKKQVTKKPVKQMGRK